MFGQHYIHISNLNPRADTPLFATTDVSLQLYHSPRVKIFAFQHQSGAQGLHCLMMHEPAKIWKFIFNAEN